MSHSPNLQLGRTTSVDHHADLQVLTRIRKFLLPKAFSVSPALLHEMNEGYGIADPLADALLTEGNKFYQPLIQELAPNLLKSKNRSVIPNLLNHPTILLYASNLPRTQSGTTLNWQKLGQLPIAVIR